MKKLFLSILFLAVCVSVFGQCWKDNFLAELKAKPKLTAIISENPSFMHAWGVLEPDELRRLNFDDLEIIDLYLKKYPSATEDLTNAFKNASTPAQRNQKILEWEAAISPPLRFAKGTTHDLPPKEVWKWEVKGVDPNDIDDIRKLKEDMLTNGYDRSRPIEVIEYRGELLLVDGHHRLAAARAAGLKDIPMDFMTDQAFVRKATSMRRFSTKQQLYRLSKTLKGKPDILPDDLMPKD